MKSATSRTRSRRRWSRATWPAVAALVAAVAVAAPASAGENAPAAPTLTKQQKAAADRLAEDHGVSRTEAQRRIERQDQLTGLASRLRKDLGGSFGGAWIDQEHGGRLVVAVTGDTAARTVRSAAARSNAAEAAGTDTVLVKRSLKDLTRISARLAARISKANKGSGHGLQSAVVTQKNAVRLDVPEGGKLNAAQRGVVRWAKKEFGDALRTGTYQQESRPLYCGGQYSCDPPVRSGLAIYGDNIRCTSAFTAYSGSSYYMLTAGHCAEGSWYWWVPTYSYGYQEVGSVADYTFGYYGDYAAVRIDDSSWWQPRGWVYPQVRISSWNYDYVGQYVCKQGSTTGYTCGQITETDATVSYPDRTLTGMTWSTACVAAGDSGSGVYYGSTAYGILSGGPFSGCGMIHEPVSRALSQLGVTLLRG